MSAQSRKNTAFSGPHTDTPNHGASRAMPRPSCGGTAVLLLVVVGDYDWVAPPSRSRELAAGIPDADLVVIPDAGHF